MKSFLLKQFVAKAMDGMSIWRWQAPVAETPKITRAYNFWFLLVGLDYIKESVAYIDAE